MATTRSLLRAAAQRLDSPGEVLERVNDLLCPDIPPNMFVTCLYAILDPAAGLLRYANAGHDLPYRRKARAAAWRSCARRGMPLGPDARHGLRGEGDSAGAGRDVLFYSDGLVEAHNPQREMFGFPRLQGLVAGAPLGRGGDGRACCWPSWRGSPARLGAGGRHHAGDPGEIGDGMTDPKPARTDADLGRTLADFCAAERARQRAHGDGAGRGSGQGPRYCRREPGAAQDRRGRGDDERDGARQPATGRRCR